MKLVKLLLAHSDVPAKKLVAMAFAAGLSSALVLMTINSATAVEVSSGRRLQLFLMFCVALGCYILSHHYVLRRTTSEVERTLHKLRHRLAEGLRRCELRALERLNRAEIVATANKDTYTISQAAHPLVNAAQASLLVLVTCLYIGYLSPLALLAGIVLTAVCVPAHLSQIKSLQAAMKESTKIETDLFGVQADFLDGAKEMRLHHPRSEDLGYTFDSRSRKAANLKSAQRVKFASVFVFSQVGFYLLLATMVFMAPQLADAEQHTVVATALAVLFILGPISTVLSGIPILANADAAAQNLERIQEQLQLAQEEVESPKSDAPDTFEVVSLHEVSFEYGEGCHFAMGPISLDLKRGQILFLTGGNGSGKSTLAKLLCGLYSPNSGKIMVDDQRVKRKRAADFRSLFSSVFTDFHLFQELHGLDVDDDEVEELIEDFGLQGKLTCKDGKLSSLELSTGQRKRIAMIIALLEDRPIMVLDEWAAEQDPEFRERFYRKLLPRFKEQGKTLVVVTHDDRYFDVADEVIKLEAGKIVEKEATDD